GGLAARGDDLNAVILRANPTLAAIRRLTKELAGQKAQLVSAVEDTDRVIAALARDRGDVQDFLVEASGVTEKTAALSADLPEAGRLLATNLVDLRERGFVENLNLFAYFGAAAQARFDSVSHLFASHPEFGPCSPYATSPVAGCNAFYGGDRAAARST